MPACPSDTAASDATRLEKALSDLRKANKKTEELQAIIKKKNATIKQNNAVIDYMLRKSPITDAVVDALQNDAVIDYLLSSNAITNGVADALRYPNNKRARDIANDGLDDEGNGPMGA